MHSTYTLATASDLNAPKKEVVPGHFVSAIVQRKWRGEARDETIRAWLASRGLDKAHVSVHAHEKGRGVDVSSRTVTL